MSPNLERAVALMNRGLMWNQQGRFEMGFPLLETAHKMEPTCRECGTAYAEALLRRGDFGLGFYLHNHYRLSRSWFKLNDHFPEWQGEPLAGKHILVVEEGGSGDCIMGLRYVPLLESLGAKVTLSIRPDMEPLVACQDWCKCGGLCLPDAPDYWVSLMSLPLHFGIVWNGPYIEAPRPLRGTSIGVCWRAGAVLDGGNFRSMTKEQYSRIVRHLGYCTNLTNGDLDRPFSDWGETANIVAGLDLVITVDTAVMHLAGAMGKPTWVLLGSWSDWKFGTGTDTMPWYPSIRLFRGGNKGFDGAVETVLQALPKISLDNAKKEAYSPILEDSWATSPTSRD